MKEHLVMEGDITPDTFIVVDFQDVRTKLFTDEQGYWFKKLNFIDDDEDVDDVGSIFLTVFFFSFYFDSNKLKFKTSKIIFYNVISCYVSYIFYTKEDISLKFLKTIENLSGQ